MLWRVWLKTVNLTLVGGNPYSFHFLSFDFVCLFVCFVVFFRTSVVHSSLGGTFSYITLDVCCPVSIVFLATLGENVSFQFEDGEDITVHFFLFLVVCVFLLKKKKKWFLCC